MSGELRSKNDKESSEFRMMDQGTSDSVSNEKLSSKYCFQASVGLNLREKMEELRNRLESMKALDISNEGEELLDSAIKSTSEEVELIKNAESIGGECVRKGSRIGLDVLNTFLEYAWSETQLAILKLWKAYKMWGEKNETFFELAKRAAEHKSLLELIKSNLDSEEMNYYPGFRKEKDFDWSSKSNEEILIDLIEEEKLLLDVYSRLGSMLGREDIQSNCRDKDWLEYFEIFGKLVRDMEDNLEKLERLRRSILFCR